MARVSNLQQPNELLLESLREDLRAQRWQRYRQNVRCAAILFSVLVIAFVLIFEVIHGAAPVSISHF
jgi:hypothetical protein